VLTGVDWVTCTGCSRDYPADEICEHDNQRTGPVCLALCCQRDHPVGRKPWEGDAA
jgi:hypothetical protein